MKKIIITTTINPPTEALIKFNSLKDWKLIVVGDLKTPHTTYKGYNYLSPKDQEAKYPNLSKLLGWNTIQRRNIGFLEAYREKADIIATVDDDNIPYDEWGKNVRVGQIVENLLTYHTSDLVFDPICVTNHYRLWHRGFPLQLLHNRNLRIEQKYQTHRIDIQADFWNGDPDIDAFCRMQFKPECSFLEKHFPFTTTRYSPFNSQNTFLSRTALRWYFMFPNIGRMDDIWASYYLEHLGFKVMYQKPSVYQARNVQNLTKNLKDEVLGYTKTIDYLDWLDNFDEVDLISPLPEESLLAFKEYINQMNLIDKNENN